MEKPYVAVDTVVFTIKDEKLAVLIIQIDSGFYAQRWAVPGGLVQESESLDEAAARILNKKAQLKDVFLEQLYTFGDPDRDRRGRSIAVAYMALIQNPEKLVISEEPYYRSVMWAPVENLPQMAFDHKQIINKAHERLKSKLSYTNIVYSLMPREFTLGQLQKVYEVILGEEIDKRNFRKKIQSLNILESLDKKQKEVTHRPAKLYSMKKKVLEIF